MKPTRSISLAVTFALLLPACASSIVARRLSAGPATALTVIATTDFHGELEGQEGITADGKTLSIGGAAVFATYLRILREQAPGPVLWIDGGDLFQGSMASNLFEGAPVVKLMNHLGLNAAALGNHEFDYGPSGDKAVPRSPSDDPRGALKARISEARFPILAANVKTIEGKTPDWLKPSAILEVEGLRVGVVGGASPGTPGTTNALNLGGLVFQGLLPALQLEAQRLRQEEHVDFVVITVHDGGSCDDNALSAQDDLSTCQASAVIELAKHLPQGLVDLIVAGHTHKGLAKKVNGIAILQPFSHGKYIGWATLPIGRGQPEVSGLVPVCSQVIQAEKGKTCDPFQIKLTKGPLERAVFFGEPISPDKHVEALLAPDLAKVRELKESPLGFQAVDLLNRNFLEESALGNLVADISREALPDVDIGLANGGGLRANINPGPVTYGDIFGVMPFDNQLALMKVNGAQLTELVKAGLFGRVGAYSWSANLSLVAEGCELRELKVNGQPVSPDQRFTIATSDFLAGGGSGVGSVKIPRENVEILWDRKFILRELSVEVLKKWKRNLRAADFFHSSAPRQKIGKKCDKNGGGP